MKLTYQQDMAVRDHLDRNLKYKEVKAEMYDHILTSLEHAPDNISYGELMNKVMADLGGTRGLRSVQRSAKWAMVKAMIRQYGHCGRIILSSVWLLPIILVTIASYLMLTTIQPFMELLGIPFMGYLTSTGVQLWQKKTQGYDEASIVTGAFDTVVPFIRFLPVTILLMPKFFCFGFDVPFPPGLFISMIFICSLHVATSIKFSFIQFDKADTLTA